MPLEEFATTTLALGMTEPDASRTVPDMDAAPADVCPKEVEVQKSNRGSKPKRNEYMGNLDYEQSSRFGRVGESEIRLPDGKKSVQAREPWIST
jgi:hypothetical protein